MDAVVFTKKFSSTVIHAQSNTNPNILGYSSPSFRKLLHMHSQILPTASASTSASDPDPGLIRIQLGQQIRIGNLIRTGFRQIKISPQKENDEISFLKSRPFRGLKIKRTYSI
jgi:hypothetical protein